MHLFSVFGFCGFTKHGIPVRFRHFLHGTLPFLWSHIIVWNHDTDSIATRSDYFYACQNDAIDTFHWFQTHPFTIHVECVAIFEDDLIEVQCVSEGLGCESKNFNGKACRPVPTTDLHVILCVILCYIICMHFFYTFCNHIKVSCISVYCPKMPHKHNHLKLWPPPCTTTSAIVRIISKLEQL